MMAPFLLDHPEVTKLFPQDAVARARQVLKHFGGAMGAYTDSRGSAGVRKEVADFLQRRDGYPSNPEVGGGPGSTGSQIAFVVNGP